MIVYNVRNLVKVYLGQTQPANDHITLQIRQSEIFSLLGDNGAGKSSIVRQMVNLLRTASGSIELLGQRISRDPLHVPLNAGYMLQETHALNNLTVDEALYFTAHLRGLSWTEARRGAVPGAVQPGDVRGFGHAAGAARVHNRYLLTRRSQDGLAAELIDGTRTRRSD